MTAQAVLLFIAASHGVYLLLLIANVKLGERQRSDEAVEAIVHLGAAYTALLWVPVALLVRLAHALVLDPLRLDIKLGAMHQDETDDRRQFKGRRMRKVAPLISVGTYAHMLWIHDLDVAGTKTNKILEIGWTRFGICVIRHGIPVPDAQPITEKATR